MKYILALTALAAGAAAFAYATPCTSTLFSSEGSPCTDTLTNVGGVAGADETITFSNFTDVGAEAGSTTSSVDLDDATGLAGFTFSYNFDAQSFFASWALGYTATITACATGFTCAITGYLDLAEVPFPGAEVLVALTGLPDEPLDMSTGYGYGDDVAVNLQTATQTGYFDGNTPLFAYEGDVYTSVTPNSSVPEPANLSLFGAGLLAVALLRRRRAVR